MTHEPDDNTVQQVKKALSEDISSLGQDTEAKLQAARFAALEAYGRDKRRRDTRFPNALIPGVIFASSLCVAIGVWMVQPDDDISTQFSDDVILQDISAQEISSNELEIVEELEFYEWLDSNGYAG